MTDCVKHYQHTHFFTRVILFVVNNTPSTWSRLNECSFVYRLQCHGMARQAHIKRSSSWLAITIYTLEHLNQLV